MRTTIASSPVARTCATTGQSHDGTEVAVVIHLIAGHTIVAQRNGNAGVVTIDPLAVIGTKSWKKGSACRTKRTMSQSASTSFDQRTHLITR